MTYLKFPRYLSIQTTSLCNASCIFCPYQEIKDLFPKKIMDMSLYKKIINECTNHKNIERIILYMNNEPLTDPYLIERINYAKEKVPWASIHILTNGLLLTEEMGDKLLDSKLDWLGISFHGIRKDTIEKAMGIPFKIAFERINKFIEKARKKKNIEEYLMITFLKHKYLTEKEKEEAFKYWQSKGIKRISYFEGPISRAGNVKSLPKVYHKKKIIGCNSIWADEMLHIVEDGKVVLCCMDWRREVILGDLNKESIYSVWNGKRKEIWEMITGQKKMTDNFLCRRCEEAVLEKEKLYSIVSKTDSSQILLVMNPCWGTDAPPISLGCLAGYLKDKGIKVEVLDSNIKVFNRAPLKIKELWSMENSYLWWTPTLFYKKIYPLLSSEIEKVSQEILNSKINTVGFSVYATNRMFTKEVIKIIKRKSDKKVIVGGRGIYDILERKNFPEGLVDYFIVGEGENALCRLIKDKKAGPGVVTNTNEDTKPVFLDNLNQYPLIKYENFDLSQYQHQQICLLMNRGCIFKCAFCNDWRYIGKLRTRNAEDIYREIEYHFYKNNIKKFYFNDQAINVNLKELNRLCDLLIKADFKIEWVALAIPWRFLTFELLLKMREAGCITLNYGIESGSNRILKLMNKQFRIEEVEKVLEDTRRAGINTQVNFIVGFPGETTEDFNKTKIFIKKNRKNICGITNLNMCNAVLGSSLSLEREKFNIEFPENLEIRDTHWFTKDKSDTYELRIKRCKELLDLTKKLELSIFTTNFPLLVQKEKQRISLSRKKEKILLTIAPMWDISLPPLGLAYLASYLENKGIFVDVLDMNIELYAKSTLERKKLWKMENYNLWAWEDLFINIRESFKKEIDFYVNRILDGGYNIVGFSLYGANILFSIEMAKRLKRMKPQIFIIFGGPSCYFLHNHPVMPIRNMVSFKTQKSFIIPGEVDAFIIGEGEKSLYELIKAYFENDFSNISGVVLYDKCSKRYVSLLPNTLIEKLDEIPSPLWEKFNLELYPFKDTLPIIFGRGCINRCSFCNDWVLWGGKYRKRSSLNIIEEIKSIIRKFNIRNFQSNDLIFNADLKLLDELADILMKKKLNIKWGAQGIIRSDMKLDLLKKLRESGLTGITYGIESLSEKVLKKMGKRYNFNDIKEVLKNTKKAGINVAVNFIVGFPGETEEDFRITKERFLSIRKYIDKVSSLNPCYVTGGTKLEKFPQRFSIILPDENWCYCWRTEDGKNTYEIRKRRTKELSKFIKKEGPNIEIKFTGIYDESSDVERVTANKQIDFLLINLPPWAQENPHIGVGYLCSYLRAKGLKPKVIDLNKRFYLNHPDFKLLWHVENKNFWSNEKTFPLICEIFEKDIEEAIKEILGFNCDILGFSVVDPKERLTIEFIKRIKQKAPNKKIILGGPATSTYEQRKIFLDSIPEFIDAFVIGEGEETLACLLDRILNKKKIIDVEGCYVRNNGKWVYKERLPINPLDKTPFPTYEEFDMRLYGKSLLVEWSRGCRGRCAFCKNYRLFSNFRVKSPDWILRELRYHKQKYDIEEFTVVDNILNGDLKNLNEVCNRIIKDNLKIRWTGQIAPHKNMDYDFFKKMREAGCFKLQIGLESGSNKVLRLMRKTFTSEISERNIRFAKKAGIETEIFTMVGFPGETEKDFKETCDFVKRNAKFIDTIKSINTLHLIAGTEVYEKATTKFNMKPLPEDNWHYLWETYDGNTYKLRKRRAQKLLDLAYSLGIRVMETNIMEGKENIFDVIKEKKNIEERLAIIRDSINTLQELPQKRKIIKKKRSIFKWLILVGVFLYTYIYIAYFAIYAKIKNKVLLGGKWSK